MSNNRRSRSALRIRVLLPVFAVLAGAIATGCGKAPQVDPEVTASAIQPVSRVELKIVKEEPGKRTGEAVYKNVVPAATLRARSAPRPPATRLPGRRGSRWASIRSCLRSPTARATCRQSVLGAENNKWSRRITATHNVTLAYTRMLLGPMDYTPGGFRHATPAEFTPRFILPEVMTTRAQALAMYVVYDSSFSCVSDSPDSYAGLAGLDFIREVPTVWDETRFLQGQIGDYLVLARRKGDTWYLGAMNNETARRVRIPLDFLGTGAFEVSQYTDGAAPDQVHVRQRRRLATQSLSLELAANGGAAARLSPAQ